MIRRLLCFVLSLALLAGQAQAQAITPPAGGNGSGTVTLFSFTNGSGFSGSVANGTSTPALSLTTTAAGVLKGSSGALVAATAGTDFLLPTGSGAALTGLQWSQIGSTPTTLGGYGIPVTGTGTAVQSSSPTLVTPALGTPSAINLTHATALPCSAMPALTGSVTSTAGTCATSGGGGGSSGFVSAHGIFLGPDGQPWQPRGINLADWALVNSSGAGGGTNNGALLLQQFPGINFVRVNCQMTSPIPQSNGNDDPSAFTAAVAILTAAHVVVEFEDHNTSATVLTGSALTTESAWYASYATMYGSNPYVWYGTMNEPQATAGNQALITTQEVATYTALRGAGATSPLLMELIGGYTTNQGGAGGSLTAASYTTLTNIAWDFHSYNWLATNGSTPYSNNYGLIASTFAATIAATQAFTTSANGTMALLLGEFGPSTSGVVQDPGGTQTTLAAQSSGYGGAAWTWFAGSSDRISDGNSNITAYGLEVAAWIAGDAIMGPVLGTTPWATTPNVLNIGPGANFDIGLSGPSLGSFTLGTYKELTIYDRDQTSAVEAAAAFKYLVSREGSGATITQSAAYGTIGSGIAFGSGTANLSWQNIATDGSTAVLRITNTSGSDSLSVITNAAPPTLGP